MDELQKISAEILDIFNNKIESLSKEQAEVLNLHNNSMNFCVELGDPQKAMWEAKQTLKYLIEITNDG
jgi:hypothetical protein|tara:strand:+ start:5800 stop:6003 length:204 start_codon:yes stop_codon:yes gene_type:complete